ncbi:DUF1302 domain-containing protein [Comamonas humi]
MKKTTKGFAALGASFSAIALLLAAPAQAANFDDVGMEGAKLTVTTDVTVGGGYRLRNPSCSLTGDPTSGGCGMSADTALWSNGDDGNLNYHKGQFYSLYSGVASEALWRAPNDEYKFMIRGTGLYDFAAGDTQRTPLSDSARHQVVRNFRLLDLWAEKKVEVGDQSGRVRVGNQVINWGESYFLLGGINATNALDYQRYATPGQQLKQIILPAPMISTSMGLSRGLSMEAYYQLNWNKNVFSPVGSYWSTSDVFGRAGPNRQLVFNNTAPNYNVGGLDPAAIARQGGQNPRNSNVYNNVANQVYTNNNGAYDLPSLGYPVNEREPGGKGGNQFGARFAYNPEDTDLNLGFYYLRYTDKSPVFTFRPSDANMTYLKNRDVFGVSANFPLGRWAIGTELSYRPRDAIALTGCFGLGGPLDSTTNNAATSFDCPAYRDNKKFQLIVNAQNSLTPSSAPFLDWIGAQSGYFLAEASWIYYPGVSKDKRYYRTINGTQVMQAPAAGGLYWYDYSNPSNTITGTQGTASSLGGAVFFSVTYDGSLISGWQVTPSIYHQQALYGYTPSAITPSWMKGVKATTLAVNFAQNPLVWQGGISYVKYWGGNTTSNGLKDRDSIGFFVTRTF